MNKYSKITIFNKQQIQVNQLINCLCCNKILTPEDKKQEQHLYPNWCYSVLPKKNGKNIHKAIGENIDLNNAADIYVTAAYSNIWCKNCEKQSSLLDNNVKNLLFGRSTSLIENLKPFNDKKLSSSKYIYFNEKESSDLYGWVCSVVLKILLNEYPNQQYLTEMFYEGMTLKNFKIKIFSMYCPLDELTISSLHIQRDYLFDSYHFNVLGLYFFCIFEKNEKQNLKIQLVEQDFGLISNRAKILINHSEDRHNYIMSFLNDFKNYESIGTTGCLIIDKTKPKNGK